MDESSKIAMEDSHTTQLPKSLAGFHRSQGAEKEIDKCSLSTFIVYKSSLRHIGHLADFLLARWPIFRTGQDSATLTGFGLW